MTKTRSLSAALCLAAMTAATGALAQTYTTDAGAAAPRRMRQVEANGRCEGLSYGTGARRCGTRTGGPVGGIPGRN